MAQPLELRDRQTSEHGEVHQERVGEVDPSSALRVAIAHDWLVRYAGSERCVFEMLAAFEDAELFTSVVNPRSMPPELRHAKPSFLQRIPGATSHHEWFLPLMPIAWKRHELPTDIQAVISSSHACAKAVPVPRHVPHLCYCHTPMRYAWDFESEKVRFPRATRGLARSGMSLFRRWDRKTAEGVTKFVANSTAVARRIRRAYGRSAEIINPPVQTEFFTPGGERGLDFLFVGRLVSYKRADLVVSAFAGLPYRLIVVGDGHLRQELQRQATTNVTFLREVDDQELRDLYRSSRALVYPAREDFGIVMAEAQACGTPVIGFSEGGATDIVLEDESGWLLQTQSITEVREAIRTAATVELDSAHIRSNAERFSVERFRNEIRNAVLSMVEGSRTHT